MEECYMNNDDSHFREYCEDVHLNYYYKPPGDGQDSGQGYLECLKQKFAMQEQYSVP